MAAPLGITPVTVLTGFLGSGKTTLLNALLADGRFADTAVLVNEWGEVPIDHALVRPASESVVALAGGCVCCRVSGDVVRTLRELHFLRAEGSIPAFRRVVIETSGLADPAPLLATLAEIPLAAARYAIAGVVTTVDAEHGERTLAAHPESVKQVAMADLLVVTKCDLAAPQAVDALQARLADLNPGAPCLRSSRAGDIDPGALLATGLHRGDRGTLDATGWLNSGAYRHLGAPRHDAEVQSFAWRSDAVRPWAEFQAALEALVREWGAGILRLKGLVHAAGEPGPRAVHAVQHTLYPSARLPEWPDHDRATRLVFIGRGLEEGRIAGILEPSPHPASTQR